MGVFVTEVWRKHWRRSTRAIAAVEGAEKEMGGEVYGGGYREGDADRKERKGRIEGERAGEVQGGGVNGVRHVPLQR